MEPWNLLDDPGDVDRGRPGHAFRTNRVAGERLGARLHVVPPGSETYPLHWHHANEELLVVLAGRPTLRTPAGERVLEPGDAEAFRRGPEGAHTLRNDSDEPVRFLMVSTLHAPDLSERPETGTVGVYSPFGTAVFRREDAVEDWERFP